VFTHFVSDFDHFLDWAGMLPISWDTCFGAGCYPTLSLDSISFLELELCINCLLIKRECL